MKLDLIAANLNERELMAIKIGDSIQLKQAFRLRLRIILFMPGDNPWPNGMPKKSIDL